ncbi:hypothetical protein NP493_1803g00014 [Ridgeia piscesae]|uniref:TIL domain-containing protein n=1 Tax=Ridgeia piscesae TaxID=27915 RepID=A0AAD9JSD6_RIDPI|nr:hypothetical protein NP493_1803g00014 [Ridgeia piscesae]
MCCFLIVLILLHLPSARFPEMSRLVPKRNVSDRSAKFRRSSCVHMQRPMRARCPRGQVWNDCGSACTATCRKPNPICMKMCVPRCECPSQRPILHCGRCIRRARCPRRRRRMV